ncbi:MAG: class IV adenylate cyclase [Planctomycetaceae bacterium]|nr:class IV adenylate cyclase [Planctomycetaceae bacterium]
MFNSQANMRMRITLINSKAIVTMQYEVEVKYKLDDVDAFRRLLQGKQAKFINTVEQEDIYMNHPSRDFAKTDEAFRIRRIGSENRLTYKGPLVDQETKTRQEIELDFAPEAHSAAQMQALMEKLGFRPVPSVHKTRDTYHFSYEETNFEIVIDNVDGLGWYVELECCVDACKQEATRIKILKLAKMFGLGPDTERRSYLRLLLEKLESA